MFVRGFCFLQLSQYVIDQERAAEQECEAHEGIFQKWREGMGEDVGRHSGRLDRYPQIQKAELAEDREQSKDETKAGRDTDGILAFLLSFFHAYLLLIFFLSLFYRICAVPSIVDRRKEKKYWHTKERFP